MIDCSSVISDRVVLNGNRLGVAFCRVWMDLETENRIAAILMKEAAELRRQAEKEGVHVYLQQPKPRVRPNPRFLTATVLGVQQGSNIYIYIYIYI